MINPSAVAADGVGFGPLALATSGWISPGIALAQGPPVSHILTLIAASQITASVAMSTSHEPIATTSTVNRTTTSEATEHDSMSETSTDTQLASNRQTDINITIEGD